jgi:hypothetical protein
VDTSYEHVFTDLKRFIIAHDVQVLERLMELDKPGEFDGPTMTINPKHDAMAACFYLAHAFGSIYQWSTDFSRAQEAFDTLRQAKADRVTGPAFERALEGWRLFEQTSSDHAVWTLDEIHHGQAIEAYTIFFRADIEAMTVYHRTGKEPRWPDFFAAWKRRVESGELRVEPFRPKPVSRFRPARIEKQEVVQERD